MNTLNWQPVPGFDSHFVAFSNPCSGKYGHKDCCTRGNHEQHGHVHLRTGRSNEARVPFCCYSRVGVVALLTLMQQAGLIDPLMWEVIWNLPEVQALPRELTRSEQQVLRSPQKRARDLMVRWSKWTS